MYEVPEDFITVTPTQDGSDSNYVFHAGDRDIEVYCDYGVRVANADRKEKIALYKDGVPVGSFSIRSLDASLERLNDVLLDDEQDLAPENID